MKNKRSYVLQAFMETPWAILPNKLEALKEIVDRHVSGEQLQAEEIETRIHGAARPLERRVNSVAVLPLFGTIFPRGNLMTQMSGATSAELFGKQFAALLQDPEVGAIVLDVNSPGGQIGGIEEVSKMIFDARGKKPIVAVANHLMASAAYWIASAADEIVSAPSADVGSIGVFAIHEDYSLALDMEGIKISLISEGKYKTEGNPYEPLSEDARAAIQKRVSEVYDDFLKAVARNRDVNVAAVRGGFGEGRVVGAREALKLGMVDRIATLDDAVNGLLGRSAAPALGKAAGNVSPAPLRAAASEEPESGQAPASDRVHMQEARARLASVGDRKIQGDEPMFLRELLKQREALLTRANELVATADKENRDLTEEERKEFNAIMGVGDDGGQVGALDAQITTIQGEREKLRQAAEKKFAVSAEAQKPDAQGTGRMKRADYEKQSATAKAEFIRNGGKVED